MFFDPPPPPQMHTINIQKILGAVLLDWNLGRGTCGPPTPQAASIRESVCALLLLCFFPVNSTSELNGIATNKDRFFLKTISDGYKCHEGN